MKTSTFLIGVAVAALTAGSAAAADMAVKARPAAPIVAPVFNWTGCYIGVHGGGGATRSDFTDSFFSEGRGSGSWGNGGLAGGQIGCNYQTGVLVLGIEGEGYWSGMKVREESLFGSGATSEGLVSEAKNKWDYTVAGRIGVAYERAFIYGKAGWAWGEYDFTSTRTSISPGNNFSDTFRGNETLNGPLFGLGVEYALTNNWTVKGEYNYINYGLSPVSFTRTQCLNGACVVDPSRFSQSFSSEKHIFKFGVNYLFNVGGGPVVARY